MFKFETNETMAEATQKMYDALGSDNDAEIKEAFEGFSASLAKEVASQTKTDLEGQFASSTEEAIMASRGTRKALTPNEKKFFAEAVEKQTVEGLDNAFPTTVIEDVMKDLTTEHPILAAIDTRYTTAAIKYIYGDPAQQTAYWDVIPADIRQILIGTFKEIDMTVSKLSGFIALPKGYFQLGPAWLANYVTTFLREVMEASLEKAVVNGDGKLKPIGMMRKLSGAVDGVYPAKDEVAITDLTPQSIAGPRALLAQEKMLNGQLSLVVNPVTNATKIAPNLFFQNTETGTWAQIGLPFAINVVESYAVPEGKAILGNLKNYLLAVAGNLNISTHPDTLAIEDMDLYIAKLFAAGVAKNPNAFVVLDVSGIDGVTVPTPEEPANLEKQDAINPVNSTDSQALDREGNAIDQTEDPEV